MKKVGVFGTCRIENWNGTDLKKVNSGMPVIYQDSRYQFLIRPLGYTTTTSDVAQNLRLIYRSEYQTIEEDPPLFREIFMKHGGQSVVTGLDYDLIIIEACSVKKIIYEIKQTEIKQTETKQTETKQYIIPYEIESKEIMPTRIETESEEETFSNLQEISRVLNGVQIVLLPPIVEFTGQHIIGIHENVRSSQHVLNYRRDILHRLRDCADKIQNVYFYDWNDLIREHGAQEMLLDQFHFTEKGYQVVASKLFNFVDCILSNQS